MRVLVTGSSGHLGEALVRVLGDEGFETVGLDVLDSPQTDVVGSIVDRALVRRSLEGVDTVLTRRRSTSRTSARTAARSSSTRT